MNTDLQSFYYCSELLERKKELDNTTQRHVLIKNVSEIFHFFETQRCLKKLYFPIKVSHI